MTASPQIKMAQLDADITTKLDFVFTGEEESKLLVLRSVLGFVRRLCYVRTQFNSSYEHVVIPLKREPARIGDALKEIIEDADYEYSVGERMGYSVVRMTGINLSAIDSLITACIQHVEQELASVSIKFS